MRIAVLFEYGSVNGGENSLLCMVPKLRCHGCEFVAVVAALGELTTRLKALQLEVINWLPNDENGRPLPQEQRRRRLGTILDQLSPDVVHANSLAMSRLVGPVAAAMNIASIGHLRDILGISRQAAVDLSRNRRLLAVSQAARDWHAGQGVDEAKLFVCHNGVDLDQFRPRSRTGYLHEELRLTRNIQFMGYVGQLGMRKGVDVWLRAARILAAEFPQLHFLMVGQKYSIKEEAAVYLDQLRDIAATSDLRGRVHWLGRRSDVPKLLNELTILVHAARQEPFGRVLLEASASGTPIVATRVGGTEEILPPSEFAECLIPPDHVSALAEYTARMLRDPTLCLAVSAKLRQRAQSCFSADAASAELVRHYHELFE